MIRRALLVLALAAIYVIVKRRHVETTASRASDQEADAQWANEGGANAPSDV